MKRHDDPNLRPYRKELRQNLTPAEAYLWKQLQNKKLEGRKFRRQHSIDRYIVDFYCASERLIIELDGEVHMNPTAEEKDLKRTKNLEGLGFTVIRFENKMVFENLRSVLQEIRSHFK
ncbi:endonuclease domain-containing protein [Flagellimonas sp. S3867]|uniref:endonuclease domain-containing protein n=1 Tax=Flagellimonas sp. S3867 TaxID=2768063 RepID=UPI001682FBD6|nr:endonuclease domain-containing protein [Flagellimonas sp. S3867]